MEEKDVKPVENLSKYERIPFIEFNDDDYNYFVKKCMFNEEMATILKMKIHDYSETKICDELCISQATLSRKLKTIKSKIKRVL